jgi:hypothetical protein
VVSVIVSCDARSWAAAAFFLKDGCLAISEKRSIACYSCLTDSASIHSCRIKNVSLSLKIETSSRRLRAVIFAIVRVS